MYTSSSSSNFSESDERSTSPEWQRSTSPEWLPGENEDGGKKKAVRLKKLKGKNWKGKVYHSRKLVRSEKDDHVLPKKLKKMEELGRTGDDVAMATTQSIINNIIVYNNPDTYFLQRKKTIIFSVISQLCCCHSLSLLSSVGTCTKNDSLLKLTLVKREQLIGSCRSYRFGSSEVVVLKPEVTAIQHQNIKVSFV